MELRNDDIVIAGFMKAGNHWVQQICRMLVQGNTEYQPNTLTYEMLEYIPPDKITPPDNPRVLEKKIKLVHLLRNPKDTFVSLYCHLSKMKGDMRYRGTWEHFFSQMLDMGFWHGDWFDHVLDWESQLASHPDIPTFVLHFEDLKRDPIGQVQKLNKFLGLDRSDELCEAIAETCVLKTMREKEEGLLRALNIFDNDSPGIYRKGEIGDWKNWFTPAQNKQFDEVYQKRMAGSKRTFTFE
nr:hypothetical protein BaRGS_002238 [Batillaria attramentaria]